MDSINHRISATYPPSQLCQGQRHHDDDSNSNRVHFTPVKTSTSTLPRAWDRKPSKSFLARSKSRKVWKRFRSSFNSIKTLNQLMEIQSGNIEESEFSLEINMGRNPGSSRGIKRQCLHVERHVQLSNNSGNGSSITIENGCYGGHEQSTDTLRGRSFLETKWESEVAGKKRKLPKSRIGDDGSDEPMTTLDDVQPEEDPDNEMANFGDAQESTTSMIDIVMQNSLEKNESSMLTPDAPARLVAESAYPGALPGKQGHAPNAGRGVTSSIKPLNNNNIEPPQDYLLASITCGSSGNMMTDDDAISDAVMNDPVQLPGEAMATPPVNPTEEVTTGDGSKQQLSVEPESTLVRSALRSSLGAEDTELLNDFVSRARAKREAKAAAEAEAATVIIAQDAEEKAKSEGMPDIIVEISSPGRRALEDLDANSPVPLNPLVSPSKPVDEKDENSGNKDIDSVSPVGRRSTRARSAKPLQRTAAPTASLRSTLSLRRAKGTEFVFLQRTESQELALLTRRNTRQNKGDSLLPKYTLQGLAQRTPEPTPPEASASCVDNIMTDADDNNNNNNNIHQNNGLARPKKRVSWNDEQLEQFEGGEIRSSENTASQGAKATTRSPAKRKAASSRTSRVQASTETGGDKAAGEAANAATTAAPRTRRMRRLGPSKVDSTTLAAITTAATTDSEGPASPSSSSSPPSPALSPASKRKKLIPKSPKATLLRTPSNSFSNEERLFLGGSRSVKTSLLKVNAGSTPMPRRVRSRS